MNFQSLVADKTCRFGHITNRCITMLLYAFACIILCWNLLAIESFNLASEPNIVIHVPLNEQININTSEKHSSYFGYTIVLREQSIIIGAPRARTIAADHEPRETGAIYKYNIESKKIEQFVFENPMQFETFAKLQQNTTEQWLGGAMDGGSTDADPLIVCAPQLKAEQYLRYRTSLYMHGVCYWTNNTLDIESQQRVTWTLSPFSAKGREGDQVTKFKGIGVHDYKMGEVGFSVHITPNNEEIISGAVGKYNDAGAVIHFDMLTQSPKASRRGPAFNGYKGYSVGSGYLESNNRQKLYFVATVPKGNQQFGLAQIYTMEPWGDKSVFNLTGDQYGESFGYSLLVDDVNGDGLDDILIGAPYRTVNDIFEAGAVYLYYNLAMKTQLNFRRSIIDSPFASRGQFGTTLSKLGDINGDGYKDIAIGAPFADDVGMVAIYFGGPDGLETQPRQILSVSDHQFAGGMFGHGISKGVDIDANGFNDLAIGAPNVDTVFVYRAYPVVKIQATIRPMETLIPIDATSIQYEICFSIQTNSTKIRVQALLLELNTDVEEKRVKIKNFKENAPFIASSQPKCVLYEPTITFDVHREFKPIVLELSYRLKNDAKIWRGSEFCNECAIVDPKWSNASIASVQYLHNTVDLKLQSVGVLSNLTLGTTTILPVKYNISNVGEQAYNTLLTVQSSFKLPFAKLPAECTEVEMGKKVECSLAKRQGFTGSTELELSFDLSAVAGVTEMNITATVCSAGNETTPDDNEIYDTVKLITTTEIWIIETSTNEVVAITSGKQTVTISTTFVIQNIGPSPLSLFDLIIELPIGYVDDKNAIQNYVGNITAQVHLEDYVNMPLDFETSSPIFPPILNTSEILILNHLSENRTNLLSCQSGQNDDMKKLCALSDIELSCGIKPGQNITLELSYEIQLAIIEKVVVNKAEYLVHVVMVNLKPETKVNGGLSIKRHFKGTVFVKITKRKTLWIYLAAIIGGLLILIGIIWLFKKLGFFKRLTKEEMEQLYRKQEMAHMKEDLYEFVAKLEEDGSDCAKMRSRIVT